MEGPLPLPPSQTVTLTALLIPLFRVAGLIVSLGIVFCVDALTRAFFGTVSGAIGWIPYAGDVLSAPVHKIEQKVSSFLGGLEQHIDASMGWYVHALAINVGRLADGSAEAGWVAWALAKAIHVTRVAVAHVPHGGTVTKQIGSVTKIVKQYVNKTVNVTKIAAHAAPAFVAKELRAVAGTLDGVISRDIPSLREQVKQAEAEAALAWKWIRDHKTVVGEGLAAGAVAWALSKLGVSWIRCNPFRQNAKQLCRSHPGWWEDLLAGAVLIVGSVSFVEFVRDAQAVEAEALAALSGLIREMPGV